MNLRITIERDTASAALAAALKLTEDHIGILGAAGRRLVHDTSRHVGEWGLSHPNKLGGARTNYWAGIAAKITPENTLQVSGDSAAVTLGGNDMPGITRAFGDVTIVPGTKTPGVKFLAIPARSEAYGMRPREFSNLVMFWGRNGPAGLKEVDQSQVSFAKNRKGETKTRRGPTSGGLVMFWFAKSATVPQDRTILPSDQEWQESVTAGASEYVDIQLKKIK